MGVLGTDFDFAYATGCWPTKGLHLPQKYLERTGSPHEVIKKTKQKKRKASTVFESPPSPENSGGEEDHGDKWMAHIAGCLQQAAAKKGCHGRACLWIYQRYHIDLTAWATTTSQQ